MLLATSKVLHIPPTDEMFADPTANSKAAMFVLASEESEVGRIRYGCRDTTERDSWMKWLARATGQTIEPIQSNLDVRRGQALIYNHL